LSQLEALPPARLSKLQGFLETFVTVSIIGAAEFDSASEIKLLVTVTDDVVVVVAAFF